MADVQGEFSLPASVRGGDLPTGKTTLVREGRAPAVNMIELTRPLGRMAAKERKGRKGRKNRGFSATGRPLGVMTERLAESGTSHGPGFLPAPLRSFAFFCGHPVRPRFLETTVKLSRIPRRLEFAHILAKVATGTVNFFTAVERRPRPSIHGATGHAGWQ